MKIVIMFARSFPSTFLGFSIGIIFTFCLLSISPMLIAVPTKITTTTTRTIKTTATTVTGVTSTLSDSVQKEASPPANLTITDENVARFYNEFYRYYELKREW
jgi:hypothetical protein